MGHYEDMLKDTAERRALLSDPDGYKPAAPAFKTPDYYLMNDPQFKFMEMHPRANFNEGPWKFHLSISEKDTPRAWDIVVDELMKSGKDNAAKVASPEQTKKFQNPENPQAGKVITIYTEENKPPQFYKDLMSRIEQRLSDAGVKAGPAFNGDRPVPGAKYAGYRNSGEGFYRAASDLEHLPKEQRYNPGNAPDPYRNFDLGHVHAKPAEPSGAKTEVRPARNGVDAASANIGKAAWQDITDRNGNHQKYLNLEKLSPDQMRQIQADLTQKGISFQIKTSSMSGADRILSVGSGGMVDVGRAQDGGKIPESGQARMYRRETMGPKELSAFNDMQENIRKFETSGPKTPDATPPASPAANAATPAVKPESGSDKIHVTPKEGIGILAGIKEGVKDIGKKSGFVGGAVLGVAAGGIALATGSSKAEAAQTVVETAVPYGETAIDVAKGDMAAAKKSATIETASNIAGVGGTAVGAVVGQILIPIPGVGAVIGGAVGGVVTGWLGGKAAEVAIDASEKKEKAATAVAKAPARPPTSVDANIPKPTQAELSGMQKAIRDGNIVVKRGEDAMPRSTAKDMSNDRGIEGNSAPRSITKNYVEQRDATPTLAQKYTAKEGAELDSGARRLSGAELENFKANILGQSTKLSMGSIDSGMSGNMAASGAAPKVDPGISGNSSIFKKDLGV